VNWRATTREDLEECLSITPAAMGHELLGKDRALAVWRSLIGNASFNSAVIESGGRIASRRIVGFGASLFVAAPFAMEEASKPKPGLNARIMASIDCNRSVVLSEDELRHQNTYGGLHVVFLCAAWKRHLLRAEEAAEVEALLALSCLEGHQGYRLCQALREATDSFDIEHIRSQRVFGTITPFDKFEHDRERPSNWNRDRALGVSKRADALAVPGSVPAILFSYHEPILQLQDEQQRLLLAALRGMTDEELRQALSAKLPAIKKRWASVFRQFSEACPGLLPELEEGLDRTKRGPQKRHHLLAYLRQHPEELRPVLRASAQRTNTGKELRAHVSREQSRD
jgi:hypothetical protein